VEDNIEIYLRGIGWVSTEWIHLAQDRDQWRVLMTTDRMKYSEIFEDLSDLWFLSTQLHGISYVKCKT
jgi:hypothetical protein